MTDPKDPFAAPDPDEPPPPPGYGPPAGGGYGQPTYGAPPPGYPQQPYGAPVQQGFNTLAIVGFIAAFCCGPAGIVLGAIAMNQIKQRGERGQGLAIAAIALGALGMIVNFFYITSR